MDDMLTRKEAAALLKVGRNTMYALLREGTIKAIKVGAQWRIRREDLLQFQKGENA